MPSDALEQPADLAEPSDKQMNGLGNLESIADGVAVDRSLEFDVPAIDALASIQDISYKSPFGDIGFFLANLDVFLNGRSSEVSGVFGEE
jgi:hypothetical protein